MRLFQTLALAVTAVLSQSTMNHPAPAKTFVQIATDAGLTSLLGAVTAANLTDAVGSLQNVTLFAPTNAAFDAIKDTASKLTPEQLKDVLLIHLTTGVFPSTSLKTTNVPSLNPKEQLQIVVEGGAVTVSGSKVIQADVMSSQGIVHVIDKVILPGSSSAATPTVTKKSFVDIAKEANLTSLLDAVTKTNLTETLAGLTNVTLFAPTDAAFESIKATTANLTTDQLKNVLLIHIAPSVYLSKSLTTTQVKSLNPNEMLSIKVSNGVVTVSGSKVVKADVESTQGVVHVIDNVILPGAGAADAKSSSSWKTGIVSASMMVLASLALIL